MQRGKRWKGRRRKPNRWKWILCGIPIIIIGWVVLTAFIKIDTNTEIIQVGNPYAYPETTATLFGADVSGIIKENGKVFENLVGEYEITYRPIFSFITHKKIVKVVDYYSPVIQLIGKEILYYEDIENYQDPGVIATDNYDGDITQNVITELLLTEENYYEIKYTVIDSSGNNTYAKRELRPYVGTVHLTFDDGPSWNNTPEILDILKQNGVTATFFVVGFEDSKTDIIRRQVAEGHTIGLHGMYHDYSRIYTSVNAIMGNFYSIEKLVNIATDGYETKYIRFPGGSSNTVSKKYCYGVMTLATQRAEKEGYVYFDWNVDSRDAGEAETADEIYNNVINSIKPGRTNIVLLHDAGDKTETVKALQKILDYCIGKGYLVKAIDEQTVPVHHNVSN